MTESLQGATSRMTDDDRRPAGVAPANIRGRMRTRIFGSVTGQGCRYMPGGGVPVEGGGGYFGILWRSRRADPRTTGERGRTHALPQSESGGSNGFGASSENLEDAWAPAFRARLHPVMPGVVPNSPPDREAAPHSPSDVDSSKRYYAFSNSFSLRSAWCANRDINT
jgi:hypothetical protein